MASSFPHINSARIRSAVIRVPLATKVILVLIVAFWCLGFVFGSQDWARLDPTKVFSGGAHRLSTYPFIHLNIFHAAINIIALTPLLEKFEQENGTLTTAILFSGPFSTFPGILYTLLSRFLYISTPIAGASSWTFILLTSTVYRASASTPQITIPSTPYTIPTALLPLVVILVVSILDPSASLLGHLCSAALGYGWGAGYLKFLAPPEKILRWVEDTFKLRQRLPGSYVSVERTTYGRYGVLPSGGSANGANGVPLGSLNGEENARRA